MISLIHIATDKCCKKGHCLEGHLDKSSHKANVQHWFAGLEPLQWLSKLAGADQIHQKHILESQTSVMLDELKSTPLF
jgi:hypothetical protein